MWRLSSPLAPHPRYLFKTGQESPSKLANENAQSFGKGINSAIYLTVSLIALPSRGVSAKHRALSAAPIKSHSPYAVSSTHQTDSLNNSATAKALQRPKTVGF